MTASTVTVQLTVSVPDRHVETLCEMAGFGISAWAEKASVNLDARTYTIWLSPEAQDVDAYPAKRVLEFDWIAKRLVHLATGTGNLPIPRQSYIAGYARAWFADLLAGNEDADGNIDAELADVIAQLVYFNGKVVFG